jgi:UDPglucose--hexose-1-phosphate uridylyltransferase
MHKTQTWLADGRECTFYDRRPMQREVPADRRSLPARPDPAELRFDVRSGRWVVIAGHRQDRMFRPSPSDCPLCPSGESVATEIPATDFEVVVFDNRFPALTTAGLDPPDLGAARLEPPDLGVAADPVGTAAAETLPRSAPIPAYGRCEIVCFSPDHDVSFADLKPDQVRLILDVWRDRTEILHATPGIEQVFCFENRGPEIGVTQPHPHGQIYAFPFVAPRTAATLERAADYRRGTGRNLYDDALAVDREAVDRVIVADESWTAFVPYAAQWPYEVHLYPNRRHRDLTSLDDVELDSLATIYLDLLQRFDRLFDTPAPYVAAWHQAPVGPAGRDFALHLELFTNRRTSTTLKHLAGTEIGMAVFSNDVVPEQAAERLRQVAL